MGVWEGSPTKSITPVLWVLNKLRSKTVLKAERKKDLLCLLRERRLEVLASSCRQNQADLASRVPGNVAQGGPPRSLLQQRGAECRLHVQASQKKKDRTEPSVRTSGFPKCVKGQKGLA